MSEARPTSFAFRDGVLHVDVPLSQMRLQWKPKPLAEELYVGRRRWRAFWPEFRILRPVETQKRKAARTVEIRLDASAKELAEQKADAFAAFRAQIDPGVVRVAEPFGSHQWALMEFMHDDAWATDLAQGNPVLAYALANNRYFRGTQPEVAAVQARWHCHRKQRELLEWLGLPGSEPFAKLLRKIPAESVYPLLLVRLGNAVKTDNRVLEYLSHVPAVNADVLELATTVKYLDLLTPKLLAEISESTETNVGDAVGDMILGAMAILEKIGPDCRMKPFTNVQQVRRFRDKADAQYIAHLQRLEAERRAALAAAERERNRRAAAAKRRIELDPRPFPAPPVPGTDDIVPLTCSGQLAEEGREQTNCAGSYSTAVQCGALYVYRVVSPERATLSIVRGANGCWRIQELKGKRNVAVKKETLWHVQAWLERYNASL
jgi:hypothetical protein